MTLSAPRKRPNNDKLTSIITYGVVLPYIVIGVAVLVPHIMIRFFNNDSWFAYADAVLVPVVAVGVGLLYFVLVLAFARSKG
ncbi:hypothetical protein L0Y34_00650 [Candidatus Parcubacteria bacterium]|nr:hypothetical protein [Candidatus Parcubacteria bacterium]